MSVAEFLHNRSATSNSLSLDQLVELAQRATPDEVNSLISLAVEHPNIYAFGELLDVPSVQAMKDSASYSLLELFAFGTYSEYKDTLGVLNLPNLNDRQLRKLKALTIIQLAQSTKRLRYDELLATLDLENVRQLEDLVIELIYRDLMRAKLDQARQTVDVEYAVGRDVRREQLGDLFRTLDLFRANYESVLRTLESQMSAANEEKRNAAVAKERLDTELNAVQKTLKTVAAGSPSHRAASCASGAAMSPCDLLDDVAAVDSSLPGANSTGSRHPKKTKKIGGAQSQTAQFGAGLSNVQPSMGQQRGGAAPQSNMLQNILSVGAGLFGVQAPLDGSVPTGSASSVSNAAQQQRK